MTNYLRTLQLNCLHSAQEKRLKLIIESIQESRADIGMLQEVNDHELMASELKKIGYDHTLLCECKNSKGEGESVMLFSKNTLTSVKNSLSRFAQPVRTVAGITEFFGVKILMISSHSAWGASVEASRLKNNERIENLSQDVKFREKVDLTILGADLNAEPDYRSVRYLLGKDLDSKNELSTLWTDGWSLAGSHDNFVTVSAKDNALAAHVASLSGALDPSTVPDRRIDYLMTRGWNYGRRGSFLNFDRLTHSSGDNISDHYGLVAEIQI